jgi:hypothetical protein
MQRAERATRLLRVVLRVVERPLCPAHDVHLVCVLDPWRASPQEHQAHETDPERPAEEEEPEFGHGAPLLPQRQRGPSNERWDCRYSKGTGLLLLYCNLYRG